jgi:mono/diheme cytochrome c family protein
MMNNAWNMARGLAAALLAFSLPAAWAGNPGPAVVMLPKYEQECAACHIAYPPGLLPAASWQRLMGTLEQHYGSDASLDAASVQEISQWLAGHAGTYKRVSEPPPDNRITRSAWFLRKHRADEVPPELWRHAAVKSASNCAACHTQATQGRFNEREIRLPR